MITDHRFDHGCSTTCKRDHQENFCVAYIHEYRQCLKKESEHGKILKVTHTTPDTYKVPLQGVSIKLSTA